MVDPIVGCLCLIIMILAAMMIFAKNPINSAFALICLMLALGGIYSFIGAHFVAALQVIVYAGAVMVLFVFSIMLMDMNQDRGQISFTSPKTLLAVFASGALFVFFAFAFFDWEVVMGKPVKDLYHLDRIKQLGGNVEALSALMFSKGFVHFELIGLLLPIAVAGALVLAKRKVD